MSQIIEFLAEVGKRLRLEDNAWLQESFALALAAGGLAEPILRGVYDDLPRMFDPQGLTAMVDKSVGIPFLDGWVPSAAPFDNVRVRAMGTRQLHITAGNVPVVAALTIVRGALTKSDDRQCDRTDSDRGGCQPSRNQARRCRLLEGR